MVPRGRQRRHDLLQAYARRWQILSTGKRLLHPLPRPVAHLRARHAPFRLPFRPARRWPRGDPVPRLILAALLLALAACAPQPPAGGAAFRRAGADIWSNAVTAPVALAGTWRQVATFSNGATAGCAPGFVTFTPQATALMAEGRLCVDGRQASFRGPMALTGLGRLRPAGQVQAPLGQDWWLLWIDVDVRTVVIGTPSGEFGFILNRDARLPADRARAAREILDWNGYDTSRLRGF